MTTRTANADRKPLPATNPDAAYAIVLAVSLAAGILATGFALSGLWVPAAVCVVVCGGIWKM